MEYYECSRNNQLDKEVNDSEVISKKDLIFDETVSLDQKKTMLVQLAAINDIEAYRAIESYLRKPNRKLYDWAYLALQESRMLIESKFLEENQVLISTGLGGEGNKLRYFIVFISADGTPLTELQQKIVRSELEYAFKSKDAVLEDILFERNYALVLSMVPLNIPVQKLFDKVLHECNEFGHFLFHDYIITNVKILSLDEIEELLLLNNTF